MNGRHAGSGLAGAGCLAWSLRRVVTTYLAPERLPGAAWSMAARRPGRQIRLRAPAAASSATVGQNAVDTVILHYGNSRRGQASLRAEANPCPGRRGASRSPLSRCAHRLRAWPELSIVIRHALR